MVEWRDQWRVSFFPFDDPPASPSDKFPRTSFGELPAIPPPLEVHHELVILVVQIEESDGSGDDLERIDDLRGVLDHHDG